MPTRAYLVQLFYVLSLTIFVFASGTTPLASIATQYSLTTSTTLPFPTATLTSNDTDDFVVADWSLSKGHISNGEADLQFIDDPFPNNQVPVSDGSSSSSSNASVLRVTYPAGSFNNKTGGAQFYTLWNSSTPFQSMLISYELAFDSGFDWVKGGKLPGIRGGPSVTGCSGGKEPNGTDCFSTRLMWRTNGAGEVYAYIPTSDNICKDKEVICNDDFGVSVQRGAFGFVAGQWSRVSLLVQLNNPPSSSNGFIALYFNDVLAISQNGVQFRTSDSVTAGGFFLLVSTFTLHSKTKNTPDNYLRTFFGGDDSSWATPNDTHTYFRNIAMWGSSSPSTMSSSAHARAAEWSWVAFVTVLAFFCGLELV
ncbi:hypothetical protein EW145_g8118 [Phellinidium pouzarii]|uniref:Polysaccharide lyase 14 domain-containing protein n=1 Tax=Phellinidium pouzarii TaxID=167371 RepID=A0A4S4K9D8_9AGAM|nr:hypothetical protein EW145_g8118 [Phellinidium pouzarii]